MLSGQLLWLSRPAHHFEGEQRRDAAWLCSSWNARYAGKPALACEAANGYLTGTLNYQRVLAHRVIWKMVHGTEPDILDHINRRKSDNRLANLRDVTKSQNCRNTGLYASNKTGVPGVSPRSRGGFEAMVRDQSGKRMSKTFPTLAEAADWRFAMEKQFGYPKAA
jgi:hypothetical protein